MQAIEFESVVDNGYILIPQRLRDKIPASIRVIVLPNGLGKDTTADAVSGTPLSERLLGVLSGTGLSLDEIRAERLSKYL
jgi:ABC-type uncharacterized transport system ATPase subunit